MHNIVWPQHLISSKISSSLQGKSNINSSGNLSPYPSLPQPLATTICFLSLCIHLFCCCLVTKLYLTLCDSMDCRTPDSTVHGFPRQKYWSGLPFPSPEHLPDRGIKPASPALAGGFFTTCIFFFLFWTCGENLIKKLILTILCCLKNFIVCEEGHLTTLFF